MQSFKLSQQKCGLVIVAHPDDETIWLSGIIMLNPKIDWTILCLSRSNDEDRAPKFALVAKKLNCHFFQENLDDLELLPYKTHVKMAKQLILKHIKNKPFDFVITHGTNGEYGHRDHKSIHEAVNDLMIHQKIKIKTALFLHYKKPKKFVPLLIPRSGADLQITLPLATYQAKINLMSKIYGFDPHGIDASYCTRVEAFIIKQYN
ncbi:MAG: PIG-L family deacetylase [bacterium]